MESPSDIKLKYRFEKIQGVKQPLSNPLERYGMYASQVVQAAPSLIPYLGFGRAEKIADGILDPGLIVPQQKIETTTEQIRIRCIEDASGPLVEYNYDMLNRICEVNLFKSFSEKYNWAEDGKLISVISGNNESTVFNYNKDGLHISTRYPNGSLFTYEYDHLQRLSAVTFPDGVTIRYTRNDIGLLIRSVIQDMQYDYVWDELNRLKEIHFTDKNGAWSLKESGKKGRMCFKFAKSSAVSFRSVSSILGNWRYDKKGNLFQMVVPGGERYVKREDQENGSALWTQNGQTIYRMDKRGTLMRIVNTDSTNTVFRRIESEGLVLLASVFGVDMLKYNTNGLLVAERGKQGYGAKYSYDRKKRLQWISINKHNIKLVWTTDGKINNIALDNSLDCRINYLKGFPDKMTIKSEGNEQMASLEFVIRCIWSWEAMQKARRIYDFNQQNN